MTCLIVYSSPNLNEFWCERRSIIIALFVSDCSRDTSRISNSALFVSGPLDCSFTLTKSTCSFCNSSSTSSGSPESYSIINISSWIIVSSGTPWRAISSNCWSGLASLLTTSNSSSLSCVSPTCPAQSSVSSSFFTSSGKPFKSSMRSSSSVFPFSQYISGCFSTTSSSSNSLSLRSRSSRDILFVSPAIFSIFSLFSKDLIVVCFRLSFSSDSMKLDSEDKTSSPSITKTSSFSPNLEDSRPLTSTKGVFTDSSSINTLAQYSFSSAVNTFSSLPVNTSLYASAYSVSFVMISLSFATIDESEFFSVSDSSWNVFCSFSSDVDCFSSKTGISSSVFSFSSLISVAIKSFWSRSVSWVDSWSLSRPCITSFSVWEGLKTLSWETFSRAEKSFVWLLPLIASPWLK